MQAASILLSQPLKRSRETLDSLYNEESNDFQLIENILATYGFKKLEEDIVKTFSVLGETIEKCSSDSKCLQNLVNPGINNPIPPAFYTIFMAFFALIIESERLPADPKKIMEALTNLQQSLQLSKR